MKTELDVLGRLFLWIHNMMDDVKNLMNELFAGFSFFSDSISDQKSFFFSLFTRIEETRAA